MASTCDADHDGPLRCQFGALKVRTHLALIETRNLSESDADCVSRRGSAPSFQRRRSTRDRSPALRVHRGFRRSVAQADQRLACSKTSASSGIINRNFFRLEDASQNRKHNESDPASPMLIKTEPGIGYRFISNEAF